MARPFTTFSVVDILGQSAPSDGGQLSRQPPLYNSCIQPPHASYTALLQGPGAVSQVMAPLPASFGSCAATTACGWSQKQHSYHSLLPYALTRGEDSEKTSHNKTERKEKRQRPDRVSNEAEVSLKTQADGDEDEDVFLPNFPRRNPARSCQIARDLNSAGDSPSPPGTCANISNDAAPPSPLQESNTTSRSGTVKDLMTGEAEEPLGK